MNTSVSAPPKIKPDDPRVKALNRTLKKEGQRPDALIQILHAVQNAFGHLPFEIIRHVTAEMRLPPSRVYGVLTFYHFFSLKPKGEHNCLVCTGTACYVKGAMEILERIQAEFGIAPGGVTVDNRLGLQTARCIGCCGLAPAVVMDEVVIPKVKAEQIRESIQARLG